MISPIEEQQFKTSLLQSRMNKSDAPDDKETKMAGQVAAMGAKTAAASVGAVDPLSQKAAEIAGTVAGEQIYKHRGLIIGIIIFSIFALIALFALSILGIWGYYCNNLAARVLMTASGIVLKCP